MKNRRLLAVFPLVLSLLASSISSLAVPSLHSELFDTGIPEILGDYLPFSTPSVLVDSKSKFQVPLWHGRLCL
jgi:hypothetical protein